MTKLRDHRLKAFFQNLRRWGRRNNLPEGRAVNRLRRRKPRTSRNQHRATFAHIIGDIVKIDRRQNAPPCVAIKDDQIELVDLIQKQLARRKCNQRQLRHRHTVLLFRGAQNGEMHQIDRRVRLEQIAPRPLARMRLARHQQHPQAVPHPVDLHHGGVVAVGQLALRFGQRELHHIHATMAQHQWHLDVAVHGQLHRKRLATIDGDSQVGPARAFGLGHSALVLDAQGDRDLLADNPEAGGGLDQQAAIPVLRLSGQQQMQRRGQRRRAVHIMDLPIGQQDRARQSRRGDFRQGL